jgi:tRNA/tmRNA/rRNA uracil-C5-methylase (TrmA/RlmC/RlmD family)
MDSLTASLQCVSLQPWHYRQRARFHLSAKTKGTSTRVLGFATDSLADDGERPLRSARDAGIQHKITSIENCKVLLPVIENAIDSLRSVLSSAGIPDGELQIELTRCHGPWNNSEQNPAGRQVSLGQSDEFLALSIFHGGRKRLNIHEKIRSKCIRELAERGLPMVLPEHGDILKIFPGSPQGVPVSEAAISPFAVHRLGFVQPHFQSPSLYRSFVETAARSITDSRMETWDLYGGSGLFAQALTSINSLEQGTAVLSRKVTIVESSVPAIQAAKLFFATQSRKPQSSIDLMPRSVGDFLTEELNHPKKPLPRIIVADPPRSGLEKLVIEKLSKLARRAGSSGAPLDLILVSCDPAAAARDIAGLLQIGFKIKNCMLVDAFAQTRHYECLTHLQH